MAAGKSSQTNTSLIALVVFIVLFLISAVLAGLFYTKFEDQKALKASADQASRKSLADKQEISGYLDEMVQTVTGQLQDVTAEAKVNGAKIMINDAVEALGDDATAIFGQKGFDLLHTIADLKEKLEASRELSSVLQGQIDELHEDLDITLKEFEEDMNNRLAEVDKAAQERDAVLEQYNALKEMMDKSVDEQIAAWEKKFDIAESNRKQQNIEIVRLNDKLLEVTVQLSEAVEKLESYKSNPDNEVLAFETDAKVFSTDLQSGLIYLDIGLKDHAFVGLTFSVYDQNAPISKDGKSKAEIEIFRVEQNSSVAKVVTSSIKNPVIEGDLAVNMAWNKKMSNSFMVIGQFDFNGDGFPDRDGRKKVTNLIDQWRGRVVDKLTIDTDFLIVGQEPEFVEKPSRATIDSNPEAEEKYEKYLAKSEAYENILARAEVFSVPVFSRDRFIKLVGYETTASKSKPLP